jgi:DNA-binding transcriptional MerR regulator
MSGLDWSHVDPNEIPSDLVFKNPVVNELSDSFLSSLGSNVNIPYVIKDKVLMSEGVWNSYYYSSATINDAYGGTDWKDRSIRNLFLDHEDLRASEWVGEVENIRMDENCLKGDLIIYDPVVAIKMAMGKPKVGISPKVKGDVDRDSKSMRSFTFQNFSIVMNPAVKTAYINNMEEVQKPMEQEVVKTEPLHEIQQPVVVEQKEAKVEEPKPPEVANPIEEPKKKYPYPEEMMDSELSEYTDFIKKMRKENPGISFAKIAEAYKNEGPKNKELEEIKKTLSELVSALKTKEESIDKAKQAETCAKNEESKAIVEVENKMSEMAKKLSEIEIKVETPEKLSVKGTGNTESVLDSDEGMYKFLSELKGGSK